MLKVLVIDCQDSFVYNLVQILRESELSSFDIVSVFDLSFEQVQSYDSLILSPGPAKPKDFPKLNQVIEQCKETHTIFGICLGHQAIAQHFGAKLVQMTEILHGHSSELVIEKEDVLFEGLSNRTAIGRYHSWVIEENSLPKDLEVLARTSPEEGAYIMALRHKALPIWGVQFHPESMITENGREYVLNFLRASIEHIKNKEKCTSQTL